MKKTPKGGKVGGTKKNQTKPNQTFILRPKLKTLKYLLEVESKIPPYVASRSDYIQLIFFRLLAVAIPYDTI